MFYFLRVFLVVTLFFSSSYLSSQNEFSKWYFGYLAGVDFSAQPPTALANGSVFSLEGVATIADNSGNLLFYTDGISVYNSTHVLMSNGSGLFGNVSSTQAAIIVKQPGNNSIYYIFNTSAVGQGGFYYSIVDMTLAAGLGSVTVKNVLLYSPTTEKQVAVRHCNGKDVWIVTHHYGTNEFRTYLLTNTGVVPNPVISASGEILNGCVACWAGHLKISPDGKKLVMASTTSVAASPLVPGGFTLFDFDAGTGVVSNSLTLLSGANIPAGNAYGVEFSSDGSKLYGSSCVTSSTLAATLYQWDICQQSNSAILASQYSVALNTALVGSLQRAIDDKIYFPVFMAQSLGVINTPNSSGVAMNLVQNGLSVSPGVGYYGLPNYINPWTKTPPLPFLKFVSCQTVLFSVPQAPTFSASCSLAPYIPSNYLWNFGDPLSGASNTSSLMSPTHNYSSVGTYTTTLILYSNCTNDTISEVITVSTPAPPLSVVGTFTICKGDKTLRTYTVTGGSNYQWSNSITTPTTSFSPTVTTVYSVSATASGCPTSKVFTITVDPCTGISTNAADDFFRMFPNPAKDYLTVEINESVKLMLMDLNGALLLEANLHPGYHKLNIANLKPGVFMVRAISGKDVWCSRWIKLEN